MTDSKQSNEKWYKKPALPILLSFIVISLSIANLFLNLPLAHLQIGEFPHEMTLNMSASGVIVGSQKNETIEKSSELDELHSYYLYNLSFQLYNSGKGSANDVEVRFSGSPQEYFSVKKMEIYVGEPLQSNLLDVSTKYYSIGLIGPGKSYTFIISCKIMAYQSDGNFTLKITSSNAGTLTKYLHYEKPKF